MPPAFRIFLITENEFLRVRRGHVTYGHSLRRFSRVENLRLERGAILDVFGRLEYFVNEFIRLLLLSQQGGEKSDRLEEVLEGVDFFLKIRLLRKWGIIDKRTASLLDKARIARNGCAHAWDLNEVSYRGRPVRESLDQFRSDLLDIWSGLLEAYRTVQDHIDVEKIIAELSRQ